MLLHNKVVQHKQGALRCQHGQSMPIWAILGMQGNTLLEQQRLRAIPDVYCRHMFTPKRSACTLSSPHLQHQAIGSKTCINALHVRKHLLATQRVLQAHTPFRSPGQAPHGHGFGTDAHHSK